MILSYPEERVFSLVRHIQAAPLEDGGWARFNKEMGTLANSHVVAVYWYNYGNGSAQLIANQGWSLAEGKTYAGYYAAKSLTQKDAKRHGPGSVYLDTMSDQRALRRCEAYNEFFLPLNSDHLALMSLLDNAQERITFGIRRGRDVGPYGPDEVRLLEYLFPYLRQSIEVWSRLETLRGLQSALHAAMDQLPHGVLLLDGHGHVVYANRPAEAILAADDGLALTRLGQCHAAHSDEDARLAALIGNCARAGAGDGMHPGGVMAVSRPSMKRRYGVHVFPIPTDVPLFSADRAAVGVFLTDPERRHRTPQKLLAELFGLTPAEERLAALLLEGLALKDCAERLGITDNTARSYMKSIFSKTGVSRQADLIRLLLSSTQPLGRANRA